MKYLAVLEYGPNNYSAYIPDVPGCIATGKTLELVERSISEALSGFLEGETPPLCKPWTLRSSNSSQKTVRSGLNLPL